MTGCFRHSVYAKESCFILLQDFNILTLRPSIIFSHFTARLGQNILDNIYKYEIKELKELKAQHVRQLWCLVVEIRTDLDLSMMIELILCHKLIIQYIQYTSM